MCQWMYSSRSNKCQRCVSVTQCIERAEKHLNPFQEPCLGFQLTSQYAQN